MSGQADHPHVPAGVFTPQRPIPTLPEDVDQFLDQALASPPRLPTLFEIDSSSASLPPQSTMSTVEEQLRQLRELAESSTQAQGQSQPNFPKGTCRWHRQFGEKSLKCATDCPRYKSFVASQGQGNGQGGRRQ